MTRVSVHPCVLRTSLYYYVQYFCAHSWMLLQKMIKWKIAMMQSSRESRREEQYYNFHTKSSIHSCRYNAIEVKLR